MLGKMRPCLKEMANFLFSRFKTESASLPHIRGKFNDAVKNHVGVAVMERRQGDYASASLMCEMMPELAKNGVTALYVSFLPSTVQPLLDKWFNDDDETPIVDFIDGLYYGHSKRQWQFYWKVMEAAKAANIRVVGLEKYDIRTHYGAVFDAPFKTMYWESHIERARERNNDKGRFIVYGHEMNALDMGGALKGIHQRLDIPRMIIKTGTPALAKLILDQHPSYVVSLPAHPQQDIICVGPYIRNMPLKYSGL
ncbi:MAG: hypothetical protein JWO78_1552 [Micavibrio sp.]|nr:hypothetical protein [Micavibrio sp.]